MRSTLLTLCLVSTCSARRPHASGQEDADESSKLDNFDAADYSSAPDFLASLLLASNPVSTGAASMRSHVQSRRRPALFSDALPAGWQAIRDETSGQTYYHDTVSGTSQWEAPKGPADESTALPPGWFAGLDEGTGQAYYYNSASGASQWTVPTIAASATTMPSPVHGKMPSSSDASPSKPSVELPREENAALFPAQNAMALSSASVPTTSSSKVPKVLEKENDEFQQNLNELAFLILRVAVAAFMIHHGQEKIIGEAAFTRYTIDKYFDFLPGPDKLWTYAVGYVEYFGPMFIALGVFSRMAATSLVAVMLGACYHGTAMAGLDGFPMFELGGLFSKMRFPVPAFHNYGFETPALYLIIFLLIAIVGPGKFSVAELLRWNDDKTLLGKVKQ